jgi:hypothetical protein
VAPAGEAGHGADVADDRGGDDRADAEQPGQAGAGRGDRGGELLAGLADPGVDAAQVLDEVGGEFAAGYRYRVLRCDHLQQVRGVSCGDRLGNAARNQLAQHRVQPAGHLSAGTAQVLVAFGPHLQHRGVVIAPGLADVGRAQRRDRDRPGVVGIVLVRIPGRQQPHPGTELGRHIQHPLTGR